MAVKAEQTKAYMADKAADAKVYVQAKMADAKETAAVKAQDAKVYMKEKAGQAQEVASEQAMIAKEKMQENAQDTKQYMKDKMGEARATAEEEFRQQQMNAKRENNPMNSTGSVYVQGQLKNKGTNATDHGGIQTIQAEDYFAKQQPMLDDKDKPAGMPHDGQQQTMQKTSATETLKNVKDTVKEKITHAKDQVKETVQTKLGKAKLEMMPTESTKDRVEYAKEALKQTNPGALENKEEYISKFTTDTASMPKNVTVKPAPSVAQGEDKLRDIRAGKVVDTKLDEYKPSAEPGEKHLKDVRAGKVVDV